MRTTDPDILTCRALVADPNATSRSIVSAQLRDLGVGTVVQCGRLVDARTRLESSEFDLVLCEQHFPGDEGGGQQLLDDLRRHRLLPLSTVFIMVTAEASYAKVAEAAESALDSYLLKPHAASALADRVHQARRRKKVLKGIFDAIDGGRIEQAAALCRVRFAQRAEYWLFAARIGAELLLNLGRHAEAAEMFESVTRSHAVPWARLGIARAQIAGNETQRAVRTIESLIDDQPTFVDAYDVMGRLQLERGNLDDAAAIYRQAAAMTPASVGRLQKVGTLAYYRGERDEATRALERAVAIGLSSKMFDFQTLVLLGFLRFRAQDTKGLHRCRQNLAHALSQAAQSRRLQRFLAIIDTLAAMLARQVAEVVARVREIANAWREPGFDFEAGCNVLALLGELTAGELSLDGVEDWVAAIAMRHCASKSQADLMQRAAAVYPPFGDVVRAAYQGVLQRSEAAVAHTLAGDPAATVRALFAEAERTLNAKFVETARMTLQRHGGRIADADGCAARADELLRLCGTAAARPLFADSGRAAGRPACLASLGAGGSPAADVAAPVEAG